MQSNNSTQNEQNDITQTKQYTLTKEHVFCVNSLSIKSPYLTQNFTPKGDWKLIPKNTFGRQIKKRKRAPNKKATKVELQNSPNKVSRDISTQTDFYSNNGKGLSVFQEDKHNYIFKKANPIFYKSHRDP